jgi:hypothetical protein
VFAVNGARVGVAVLLGRYSGASDTAVGNRSDDRLGTGLHTTTTDFSAAGPGRPGRGLAVDRAGESVASGAGPEGGASNTTVASLGDDGLGVGLGTTGAGRGACSPPVPVGKLAVDRTTEGVAAHNNLAVLGANTTTVGGSSYNGTGLGLGASATGGSAGREGRPGGDLAVDGAGKRVASDGLCCGVGARAAEQSTLENLAGKHLGTTATRLGALGCYNVGNAAVDWLGGRVGGRGRGWHALDVPDNDRLGEVRLCNEIAQRVTEERRKVRHADATGSHSDLEDAVVKTDESAGTINIDVQNVACAEGILEELQDLLLENGKISVERGLDDLHVERDMDKRGGSGGGGGELRRLGDDVGVGVVLLLFSEGTGFCGPLAFVTGLSDVIDAGVEVRTGAAVVEGPGLFGGTAIEGHGRDSGRIYGGTAVLEDFVRDGAPGVDLVGLTKLALEARKITPATPALYDGTSSSGVSVSELGVRVVVTAQTFHVAAVLGRGKPHLKGDVRAVLAPTVVATCMNFFACVGLSAGNLNSGQVATLGPYNSVRGTTVGGFVVELDVASAVNGERVSAILDTDGMVSADNRTGVELLHASAHRELAVDALGEHVLADALEVVLVAREDGVVRITTGHAVHYFAGGAVARLAVAGFRGGGDGARHAAELGRGDDRPRTHSRTSATGLGAGTVTSPTRKRAVDGATEGVAGGGGRESGAASAAIGSLGYNRTRLGLRASAAGLAAGAVSGPARDLAVSGAGLGIASSLFLVRAGVTAVRCSLHNSVATNLGTGFTGLGASTPGVPGMNAVIRARVSVAVLLALDGIAVFATVGDVGDNRPGTGLDATATKLVASCPCIPVGEDTVDGTGLSRAYAVLCINWAGYATVRYVGNNGTDAGLTASGARNGASRPCSPG